MTSCGLWFDILDRSCVRIRCGWSSLTLSPIIIKESYGGTSTVVISGFGPDFGRGIFR
jgi:hypothetical protein